MDTTDTTHKKQETQSVNDQVPFQWMVKPCEVYRYELKDCKSWADRFHQYWVEGKLRDCEPWDKAHKNCLQWEEKADFDALAQLIEIEKSRSRKRLLDHSANDVWQDRYGPPADWAKELPDDIKKTYEGSFLQIKATEIRNGTFDIETPTKREFVFSGSRCIIL